jgi:signal transduction histidine kinase
VVEARRISLPLGVLLALTIVALFEVLALLQGVRSTRRLRARVTDDIQRQVEAAWPRLRASLGGGRSGWSEAAALALQLGIASEVDVLDGEERVLYSRPRPAPVVHTLLPDQRESLRRGKILTIVARDGPTLRALSYAGFPAGGVILRLATPVPDLGEETSERQKLLLGHGAALGALLLAAVLVLLPRARPELPSPGALEAYEEAMERLRDRGQEMSARHEAERRRMEDTLHDKDALARAGELTAGIVHEVRNGLGTIVGYARLVERGEDRAAAAEAARSIREECETLEAVVRRFHDFIRWERLDLATVDLARLLSRVLARELRGRTGVVPLVRGLEATLDVRGDEDLLERGFENLVRNAADAAEEGGGHVEVTAERADDHVVVRIEDDGPGLPPGHPEDARPFFTTKAGGLGLGLPIARKVLLLHGGHLSVGNREPRGVTARVSLPVEGPES